MMIHSRYTSLVLTFWPIYPANTLTVTGTIVSCIGYLGVLAGLKENRCMFVSFYVLLFILMLVELAMGCVFLVYAREIYNYFEADLTHSLEIYRGGTPEATKTLIDDFDAVQHVFKCCGVHGPADWVDNIPISCCTEDPCNKVNFPYWQRGCMVPLREWFAHNYRATGAGVVSMFILQVHALLICGFFDSL
uniref:Tetraspanin n=1 Tax=Neogobius melanostomus TaxID=47308 RepID=A0A8C6SLT7_9GOBI